MTKLLAKEWKLCMHPMGFFIPLLCALVLVPNYPYGVCCFYVGLLIFFICLSARENHDAGFTLTLPVSREDAVRARILFCVILQCVSILLMGGFILLKGVIGNMPNQAGLDANLAMIGEAFLIYAIFNLVFFPLYYKDITKPGKAFVIAGAAIFAWVIFEIAATYTVPFVQFKLDRPDPEYMAEKGLFTLGAFALYAAGTYSAALRSAKKFSATDLAL